MPWMNPLSELNSIYLFEYIVFGKFSHQCMFKRGSVVLHCVLHSYTNLLYWKDMCENEFREVRWELIFIQCLNFMCVILYY